MIIAVAIGIFKDAVDKMLDTSCDEEFETKLKDFVIAFSEEVHQQTGVDYIRTRKFGERIYVELEINLDGNLKLNESHEIAEKLHDKIEQEFTDIKHVMIHVNPAGFNYKVQEKL